MADDTIIRVEENTNYIIKSSAIQGPAGPIGPTGATGAIGPQGPKGDTGADFLIDANGPYANRYLYDSEVENFSFLATDTSVVYFKQTTTSGDWSPGVPFGKGDTGDTGPQGPTGASGTIGLQGPQGPQGIQGPEGLVGPGFEGRFQLANGATYAVVEYPVTLSGSSLTASGIDYTVVVSMYNEVDADPSIYSWVITDRTNDNFTIEFSGDIDSDNYWIHYIVGSLAGLQGPPGSSIAKWYDGDGSPIAGFGDYGDYYLDAQNGDVYTNISGSGWGIVANIMGPEGPVGDPGTPGPSDHGSLTGLSDDDHTQYILADGTRAFSAVITGVTPTTAAHLATKGYVDSGDHTRAHTMTSTSDHSAGNWKLFYSDGSGHVQELTNGTSGYLLKSNGATAAPSWYDYTANHTHDKITEGNSTVEVVDTGSNSTITLTIDGSEIAQYTQYGLQLLNTGAQANEFSTDGTLAGDSNTAIPTEKAVKTYCDNYVPYLIAQSDATVYISGKSNNISFVGGGGSKAVLDSTGLHFGTAGSIAASLPTYQFNCSANDNSRVALSSHGTTYYPSLAFCLSEGNAATPTRKSPTTSSNYYGSLEAYAYNGSTYSMTSQIQLAGSSATAGQSTGYIHFRVKDTSYAITDVMRLYYGNITLYKPLIFNAYPSVSINEFSTDGTLAGNSDTAIPTEKAVKTYCDGLGVHTRLHTMTSTSDHSAGNWKLFYSDGSGHVQELTNGTSGQYLTSNGATSAPSWGDLVVSASGSAHSTLSELDYASSGHTGFASTTDLTTTSGSLVSYIDQQIATVSGGGGTTDHSALSNLDYASSGHTGFASSTDLANTSGTLQSQIDTFSSDSITEGNTTVETVDAGTGYVNVNVDGTDQIRYYDGTIYAGDKVDGNASGLSGIFYLQKETLDELPTFVFDMAQGSAGNSGRIYFNKSRGTLASRTTIADGDTIGSFVFVGYDGSAIRATGGVKCTADGTVSASTVPMKLAFETGTTTSRSARLNIRAGGTVEPGADGTQDFGASGARWKDIYATNSTIQTSDENAKRNIEDTVLGLDFIDNLRPVSYMWKDFTSTVISTDADDMEVEEDITITHHRKHQGLIAQEVMTTLSGLNISTEDFAGIIYDENTNSYGLRYTELIAPMIKAIQELKERIEVLEAN